MRQAQAVWAAAEDLGDRLASEAEVPAARAKERATEHKCALTKPATMLVDMRATPVCKVAKLELERSASMRRLAPRAMELATVEELAEGATQIRPQEEEPQAQGATTGERALEEKLEGTEADVAHSSFSSPLSSSLNLAGWAKMANQ